MNLQIPIDLLLEKILGANYNQNHVIILGIIIILVVMILKGVKKK